MDDKKKTAVVGFDGAVDTRVRVVKAERSREESGSGGNEDNSFSCPGRDYYASLSGFGRELAGHQEKNCSFELEKIAEHFGGNAPNMADVLSRLGVDTTVIGTMGTPELHPAFRDAAGRKISYGEPASTLALEFEDGKTFLEQNPDHPDAWEEIRKQLNRENENLSEMFQQADMLALVNWSELCYAGKLWEDVYRDCLADDEPDFSKYVFFDLCDVSRRSEKDIKQVLSLIGKYSERRYTVLGLNQNEAEVLGRIAGAGTERAAVGKKLQENYGIREIVIHSRKENFLLTERGISVSEPVSFVEHPAVLTGAGDHFSAAYCKALLDGMKPAERLHFASVYAEEYVRYGKE